MQSGYHHSLYSMLVATETEIMDAHAWDGVYSPGILNTQILQGSVRSVMLETLNDPVSALGSKTLSQSNISWEATKMPHVTEITRERLNLLYEKWDDDFLTS